MCLCKRLPGPTQAASLSRASLWTHKVAELTSRVLPSHSLETRKPSAACNRVPDTVLWIAVETVRALCSDCLPAQCHLAKGFLSFWSLGETWWGHPRTAPSLLSKTCISTGRGRGERRGCWSLSSWLTLSPRKRTGLCPYLLLMDWCCFSFVKSHQHHLKQATFRKRMN